MLSVSIHWVPALQAFGISFMMSVVSSVLAVILAERFDRSNGNENGYISFVILMAGIIIANLLSIGVALFFGISLVLFVAVGVILLLFVAIAIWIRYGAGNEEF